MDVSLQPSGLDVSGLTASRGPMTPLHKSRNQQREKTCFDFHFKVPEDTNGLPELPKDNDGLPKLWVFNRSSLTPHPYKLPPHLLGQRAHLQFDISNRMVLRWAAIPESGVESGQCSLLEYPLMQPVDWQSGEKAPTSQGGEWKADKVAILTFLIQVLVAQRGSELRKIQDSTGARLIHCLMLSNEERSLDLAERILHICPNMLLDVHGRGPPMVAKFEGEGTLHILAVNKRSEHLERILQLAKDRLDAEEFVALLSQKAVGSFFRKAPMNSFGATPIAYFAVFAQKSVLERLFGDARVETGPAPWLNPDEAYELMNGLRARDDSVGASGYSPLHAVVANERLDMFDYLTEACGAEAHDTTGQHGRDRAGVDGRTPPALRDNTGCTPLQLAARLGLKVTFKHVLQTQVNPVWQWGPVSESLIPLVEIDSAQSNNVRTVMELTCHNAAIDGAKELLDDNFLGGFIFDQFLRKWSKFGRWIFLVRLTLHAGFTSLISLIAAPSILSPTTAGLTHMEARGVPRLNTERTAATVQLGLSVVLLLLEGNEIFLSLRSPETRATRMQPSQRRRPRRQGQEEKEASEEEADYSPHSRRATSSSAGHSHLRDGFVSEKLVGAY